MGRCVVKVEVTLFDALSMDTLRIRQAEEAFFDVITFDPSTLYSPINSYGELTPSHSRKQRQYSYARACLRHRRCRPRPIEMFYCVPYRR